MATKTLEASENASVKRGFRNVPCIRCGECNTVNVDLETQDLYCTSCEETFTADDVRAILESWPRVLQWLELAPVLEDEES